MDPAAFPPGLVGVPCATLSRYSDFHACLDRLILPPGSAVRHEPGESFIVNVNALIRQMAPEHQWWCLLADDHTFQPDFVLHLLAHDVAVVAPLCRLRRPPFGPSMFRWTHAGYRQIPFTDLQDKRGLYPVAATGCAGMVLRREVLDALGAPWFRIHPEAIDTAKEEMDFCERLTQAGYPIWIDLDTQLHHIAPLALGSYQEPDGTWQCGWWTMGYAGTLVPHFLPPPEVP